VLGKGVRNEELYFNQIVMWWNKSSPIRYIIPQDEIYIDTPTKLKRPQLYKLTTCIIKYNYV